MLLVSACAPIQIPGSTEPEEEFSKDIVPENSGDDQEVELPDEPVITPEIETETPVIEVTEIPPVEVVYDMIDLPWFYYSPEGIDHIRLTFDTSLWEKIKWEGSDDFMELSSLSSPGCSIMTRGYRDGGIQNYTYSEEKIMVGETQFTLINEINPLGVVDLQHIEWNNLGLTINPGEDGQRCIDEVWNVIRLSEDDQFGIN
jgi:hypothetical protein